MDEIQKDKIQIVNWILTRRCNLECSYCAIVRNYQNMPREYPKMKYYHQNEMDTNWVIEILRRLKLHNPDCFQIFYGGEPILRKDLSKIINYCNKYNIHYTIITNNSDELQPMLEALLNSTDYITGLTSSVDPLKTSDKTDSDRIKKSTAGIKRLTIYRGIIKDLVAEVTVDSRNVRYLYDLVQELTELEINSDINFIDIAKNPYYDFSNVTDRSLLVHPSSELKEQFDRIVNDKLDVHMAETLLPKIYEILPCELDCGIEKDIHNLTIDSDGSLRLCLRIRGIKAPKFKANNFIKDSGELNLDFKKSLKTDKEAYCERCNHSCMIMSKLLSGDEKHHDDLVHTVKRLGD